MKSSPTIIAIIALIIVGAVGGTIATVNHRNTVNHNNMVMQQADAKMKADETKAMQAKEDAAAMKMTEDAKMKAEQTGQTTTAPAAGDAMMRDDTTKPTEQ